MSKLETRLSYALHLCGCSAALALPASAQSLVVPPGTTLTYKTTGEPLVLDSLVVDVGGTLEVVGDKQFVVYARDRIVLLGALLVEGQDAEVDWGAAGTLAPGGDSAPGGGDGGFASTGVGVPSLMGQFGSKPASFVGIPYAHGGGGGQSGFGWLDPRAAGGGGGTLALAQPSSDGSSGDGLVPMAGSDGSAQTQSPSTGATPLGGTAEPWIFYDGDGRNDFWGRKLVSTSGGVVVGEAKKAHGGFGGGAGGDVVQGPAFFEQDWPNQVPYLPEFARKGGAGGGGGGLIQLRTGLFEIGPQGSLSVNGGDGGRGYHGAHSAAGSGGGGSGGWMVLSARVFDLRYAKPNSLTSLGGLGGEGEFGLESVGAGGNGGPGVIQLHTVDGSMDSILLPLGLDLDRFSSPDAHVLLPIE